MIMKIIFKQLSFRNFCCLLILILAICSGLYGQDVQFDRINKSDGFPSDWIYSLVQDQQGFLWVGGLSGLSRYDGYNIKTYRHDPLDSTSLSNNYVKALYEDREGRLWAGTWGGGLNLFDSGKEIFTRFWHERGNPTSLSSDSVNVILQTTDGTIWVGTQNGLDRLDIDNGTFIRYTHDADNERTPTSNVINALYEDQDDNLWVGTGDATDPTGRVGGLNRYDSTTDSFIRVLPRAQESLRDNRVTAVGGASNGAIYIGTCQSGLYRYDPMGGELEALGDDNNDLKHLHAPKGIKTSTQSAAVDVIRRDKTGMLWVATYSGGINRYDPTTHTLTLYRYQAGDPNSLSSNKVLSFYEDHQGILWGGTLGSGLNKIVPSFSRFRLYGAKEISANNGVRSLYQDIKGILWIGTFSGQVFQMDPATGNTQRFSDTKPAPDGLWGNPVESVFKDQEGMLWVGQIGGLYRIDPVRKNHRKFTVDAANPDSLSNSNVMFIRQSDDKHLWIGTWGGGLNQYDFKSKRFRRFQHDPSDPKSLSDNKLMQMYTDHQGILWFGTEGGGVDRFDKKTETFTTYLDGEIIFQIYEDSSDRFWVTTVSNGLFLLDRNTGKTIHYTKEDGLPNNVVPGITQDKQGLLWLATSGGVARFDPRTKTFITYDEADGMNNYPVIQQAVIKGLDGRMFIGGPKGVTAINPQDFKPNPNPPVTAITGLHVFEDAYSLSVNREEQITLKYNQNELTFDYAGLHFANPSRNRYTYRLDGYDKNWIDAGTARSAKYTNLSPGTYTFRVKSSNSDGVWDEKGTSLTVKILPPWWLTTMAYVIYALLGIAFIVLLNRFLRRRLVAKERERTRELELEQAREALQQASLDRVRAGIASMRTAKDLERITPLIWRELTTLGVPFFRCGVFIIDEATEHVHVYLSSPSGQAIAALHLKFNSSALVNQIVEHWQKQKVYHEEWDQMQFINWTQSLIELNQIDNPKKFQDAEKAPERLVLQFIPFTQGMLYVGNTSPLTDEEIELVQSLAETFSVAYARYEDFKNLEEAKAKVDYTLSELQATQKQLIQSEKMASLGELTAGIAHEIQNPLNFVNNFSEVNKEMLEELQGERLKPGAERNEALQDEIINDVISNEEKINHHGTRADAIVKSMLEHSRTSTGQKGPTDINALCDEYLRLAYHGLRAKDKNFNAEIKTDFDNSIGKVNIVPQDIGRVILNLINNAFYAVNEKRTMNNEQYEPMVTVSTKKSGDRISIGVKDNGNGIPDSIKEKIFQPFFTTKPTGQGTGLGLSLSYDIIKAHGGEIKAKSREGEGTEFVIQLPA
jgi:ligand-binding sensor domain-containing protein/signal transduction histidine kinase